MRSPGERRALREIERALRDEDPVWVRQFAAPVDPRARFVRRLADAFLSVAVLLIVCGLLLTDRVMVTGGCLVLLMMPITVCLVAAAQPTTRSDRKDPSP